MPPPSPLPSLTRALALPRAVVSSVEVLVTFAVLGLVFRGRGFTFAATVTLGPLVLMLFAQWILEHLRHVRPLEALASRKLKGTLTADDRVQLAEGLVELPRRAVKARMFAWIVTTATLVAASANVDIPMPDVMAVAGASMLAALTFLLVRAWWFRRAAERALLPLLENALIDRYEGRTIRERLYVASALPGSLAAAAAIAWDVLYMQLELERVRGILSLLPILVVFVTLPLAWIVWRLSAPLRAHLAGKPPESPADGPWRLRDPVVDPGPERALAVATNLPWHYTALSLPLWCLATIAVSVQHVALGGPFLEGVLLFAGNVSIGLVAASIQLPWSRRVLLPAREACGRLLTQAQRARQASLVPLRHRFVAAILVVLAGAMTIAYSTLYLQHRAFASQAASVEAREQLASRPDVIAQVAEASSRPAALSSLPPATRSDLVLFERGELTWSDRPLVVPEGPARQLRAGRSSVVLARDRLSLALVPLDATTSLGLVRPWRELEGTFNVKNLTLLFGLLGALAVGVAIVLGRDLTRSLKTLGEYARTLGSGALHVRAPLLEPDETGELAHTLEHMRQRLSEQLLAVRELNLGLERKVVERTAELEHALEQLRATQAQVVHVEKMATVGRLSAGVAHEINNPLNFIANAVRPLEEQFGDLEKILALHRAGRHEDAAKESARLKLEEGLAEVQDVLRIMKNGVQRTQRIVRGLRDFSRRDEGEQRVEKDVRELLDESVALLAHDLTPRIRIERDYAEDARAQVWPGALGQVLLNLVANAAQAIDGTGTITLSTRIEDDELVTAVRDSGRGIPPDVLPKIFDPFFTTKDVGQGTGLGLSIAHGIVERHGGRIEVESEPGRTEVRVRLPRALNAQRTAS